MSDQSKQGSWLKVFCPEGRCLTQEEVAELPAEAQAVAAKQGGKGLWLEVFCPDDSCTTGPEQFWSARRGRDQKGGKGLWLEMFCPDESCLAGEPTDEP